MKQLDNLIWAAALFIPLMTLIAVLAGPLRLAIGHWGSQWESSTAERDAKAQQILAGIQEDQHRLAVSRGLLAEETDRERARLAAETAHYETDRAAAAKTLDAAVEARRRVIAARAEAEAALAPETAKTVLGGSGEWLAAAYAAYCEAYDYAEPLPFGKWVNGFTGMPRG